MCWPRKWPIVARNFDRVHLDLIGPFPENNTRCKYICVMVDTLSRFTHLYAIRDKTAGSVANALRYFITQVGCPRIIITDNGLEFVNKIIRDVVDGLGIKTFQVQAYRPSANGLVESHNRSIGNILRSLVDDEEGNWVEALPTVQFALNSAYNRSIGETPFYMVYGQDPKLPYNIMCDKMDKVFESYSELRRYLNDRRRKIFERVKLILERSNESYREEFNKRHNARDTTIRVGDRVYIKRMQVRKNKLESPYMGPFRVMDIRNNVARLLNLGNLRSYMYHLSLLFKSKLVGINEMEGEGCDEELNEVYPRDTEPNELEEVCYAPVFAEREREREGREDVSKR